MDEIEDFEKFHDQIIFENLQLKAKLFALEELVRSSLFLLFDNDNNFNKLMEESLMKEASNFDNLSRNLYVYNSRNTNDLRRSYLLELQSKLEKVR